MEKRALRFVAFAVLLAWALFAFVAAGQLRSWGEDPAGYWTVAAVVILLGLIQALIVRGIAGWLETRPCPRCSARLRVQPEGGHACPHCSLTDSLVITDVIPGGHVEGSARQPRNLAE